MALYEMRKFVAPEFMFGIGARRRAGHYARNLMARRVFLVTDAGIVAAGLLDDIRADLAAFSIESVVFSEVSPNPRDHEVMAGAEAYRRERCDVIVALGGGSVIDCAKAIGITHTNGCSVHAFEGVDQVDVPGPPLICIPTTAGTSADISQFCIIINSEERYKMAIISKTVVPDIALVDPEATASMPPYLTACTGFDALTHAIEAFVSTASSPVVDVHALAAISLIWRNIAQAAAAPGDVEARENMMLGSLQAGLAFSNASLGAVHALAHSLGGYLDMPHGECNAVLLEHVVRFNYSASPERFRRIADAMDLNTRGMADSECVRRITHSLKAKREQLGIVDGLAARGVRSGDLSALSEHAVKDACVVTNPRYMGRGDAEAIYADAL